MSDTSKRSEEVHVLFVDDEAHSEIAPYIRSFHDYIAERDGVHLVRHNDQTLRIHLETHTTQAQRTLKFGLHPVDCVVIDVFFDGQANDGFWLLDELTKMRPRIPSVVLTGRPSSDLAFDAGRLKADVFLPKQSFLAREDPDRLDRLLGEIIHQIERKRDQPALYDFAHEAGADAYADKGYDETEWSYPGTAAYYVFENNKIIQLVDLLLEERGQVSICDVGCGTGRIEELLLGKYDLEQVGVRITAVDFAGRMLKRLEDKGLRKEGEHFRLVRGVAERLDQLESESFDLVILGFGVPSYTRYHYTLAEAARLCRPGGFGLFSVYNAESVAYDAEARAPADWTPEQRPVAAMTDREAGKLDVGGEHEFSCEAFTGEMFSLLLRRNGFAPGTDVEGIPPATFPTLLASLSRAEVEQMADVERSVTLVRHLSHQCIFSPSLFRNDLALSQAVGNRGHYIVYCARRDGSQEV